MTTAATEVRAISPALVPNVDAGVRFRADVDDHKMTILRDDGLYRHLRFKAEAGSFYWFDLTTWPGALTFRGDMGTFTFARTDDMLQFFRSKKGWPVDDPHRINPGYWAEKTPDCGRSLKEYDKAVLTRHVWEKVNDYLEHAGWPDRVEQELREQVQTEVIDELDDYEHHDRELVDSFGFSQPDIGDGQAYEFSFGETWEWDNTEWSFHFLWACHAIITGIEQYDAAKKAQEASRAHHRIVWTHDRDTVTARAECDGPEGATCRLTCAEPTCADEEFTGFHRDKDGNPFHTSGEDDDGKEIVHPMKDGGLCNVCEFLNEGGCIDEEAVESQPFDIGSVPIEPVWAGDHYEWKREGALALEGGAS